LCCLFDRTARGKNQGAALSFVSVGEMPKFEKMKQDLSGDYGMQCARNNIMVGV